MKTLVVGAGGGGIASALLASRRGEEVTLLESHSALGGCASWFRRGKFTFDVGATTLSGLGPSGPMRELFDIVGSFPKLIVADPGIVFHLSSGKVISYHRDFERWMTELESHFPNLSHRAFWELVKKVSEESWSLLHEVRDLPWGVLKHPGYYSLVKWLLLSTDHVLKHHRLDFKEYQELINGILLISAQAHSENVPFLVGAMGLSYPSEAYAPVGGMKGLMDFFVKTLQEEGVELRLRQRVQKFSQGRVHLKSGEVLQGDRLILNLSHWNLAKMCEGKLQRGLQKISNRRPGAWGAFTIYFGVKSSVYELYHQVHINHPSVPNYFVSFSHPHDSERAPEGYQAITISTHVPAEDDIDREKLKRIILEDFMNRFSVSDIQYLITGTPKTFERYTGRSKGFVGGVPFLYGSNPLTFPSPFTAEEEVFRVGDTVFPGQGLCGVVAGALQLHKHLA